MGSVERAEVIRLLTSLNERPSAYSPEEVRRIAALAVIELEASHRRRKPPTTPRQIEGQLTIEDALNVSPPGGSLRQPPT